MLTIPMGLVLTALRQALFQKVCESQHEGGKLLPLYLKLTGGLFLMAAPPAVVLMIGRRRSSPGYLVLNGGSRRVCQKLGVVAHDVVLQLPAGPFARLIRIQRLTFVYHMTMLVARTSALVLGGLYLSAGASIEVFAAVGAVMNLLLILMVGRAVKRKEGVLAFDKVEPVPAAN